MNISPINPQDVDKLLTARVAQAKANMDEKFLDMDPQDSGDWIELMNRKSDLVGATFAEQQNLIIQHHLAKTILSST